MFTSLQRSGPSANPVVYAAIEFPDLEREQACYDYVAADAEPVRTVHRAMNTLVKKGSSHFFVASDV